MKTIRDLKLPAASSAVTHVYDHITKKIYDVELHKHLQKVREDLASGRPVYVPKRKAYRTIPAGTGRQRAKPQLTLAVIEQSVAAFFYFCSSNLLMHSWNGGR